MEENDVKSTSGGTRLELRNKKDESFFDSETNETKKI